MPPAGQNDNSWREKQTKPKTNNDCTVPAPVKTGTHVMMEGCSSLRSC